MVIVFVIFVVAAAVVAVVAVVIVIVLVAVLLVVVAAGYMLDTCTCPHLFFPIQVWNLVLKLSLFFVV